MGGHLVDEYGVESGEGGQVEVFLLFQAREQPGCQMPVVLNMLLVELVVLLEYLLFDVLVIVLQMTFKNFSFIELVHFDPHEFLQCGSSGKIPALHSDSWGRFLQLADTKQLIVFVNDGMDGILPLDCLHHVAAIQDPIKFSHRDRHDIAQLAVFLPEHAVNIQHLQLERVGVAGDSGQFIRDDVLALEFGLEGVRVSEGTRPFTATAALLPPDFYLLHQQLLLPRYLLFAI